MATIKVTYIQQVVHSETIHWPDDELDMFDHNNLLCNLEHDEGEIEITRVTKDGERHEF